ncbi:hypothetical protein JCM10207_001545 [Rhodosporidiobolus poonsookiae]
MNDRQTDELMALQAIYPDTVSWKLLSEDKGVKVTVVLPVEFEADVEVEVVDWAPPPSQEARVDDVARAMGSVKLEEQGEAMGEKEKAGGRNKRRRGRGGKAPSSGAAGQGRLAAEAVPFQPAQARRADRAAAPSGRTSAVSPKSPLPTQPRPAPPPPTTSSSPPPLSNNPTPRIRFAPRAPSPPPLAEVALPSPAATAEDEPGKLKRLALRYLPPLELSVVLPERYPETEGPREVEIGEEMGWLSEERRKTAEKKLREVWAGEECLFPLVELVSSSSPDFLSTFSLAFPLTLHQYQPSSSSPTPPTPLSTTLLSFTSTSAHSAFSTSSHPCPLCFSTVRGSSCIRLASCTCIFCVPCLASYFGLLIAEGLVRSVACPSTECVEERARWEKENAGREAEKEAERPGRVTAEEVERICGREKRKRWEWLREKVRVESDPTIAFCPIDSCQAAVPKLPDEDKLRICPSCSFSFCQFCRRAWHGARNACALPQSSAIVQAYLDGGSSDRLALEARYGAANLKRLVAAYEEERALQEWLDKNSTRCPGCDVPVQKSQGCNHMTCAKCASHFCYRCGKSISPTDPYKHFSTPGASCYGKLFDFNPGSEPRVEEWLGDIIGEEEGY